MSELTTWVKPNGNEIRINSDMEEFARKMGWKKKKGRKKKEEKPDKGE